MNEFTDRWNSKKESDRERFLNIFSNVGLRLYDKEKTKEPKFDYEFKNNEEHFKKIYSRRIYRR